MFVNEFGGGIGAIEMIEEGWIRRGMWEEKVGELGSVCTGKPVCVLGINAPGYPAKDQAKRRAMTWLGKQELEAWSRLFSLHPTQHYKMNFARGAYGVATLDVFVGQTFLQSPVIPRDVACSRDTLLRGISA